MRHVGGAGSGAPYFIPDAAVPIPQPRPAVNAPRMVNFTGVPEGMGGNSYYGEGLGDIAAQREALAKAAGGGGAIGGLQNVHEPLGGIGYALGEFENALGDYRARQAEKATRDTLAGIMGGIDPTKGPTQQDVQAAMAADPAYGQKLYEQMISLANAEHWTQDPNNPNLQINTKTGETKSTGDPTGATKMSDINSVIGHIESLPSYKNMAQAVPMWSSLQDAYTRDTPQADLNMVIAVAKLFDPTSVVRTQEGDAVLDTGGLPQGLYAQFLKLTGDPSSRLGADVRNGIMAEAQSRMQGYYQSWERDKQQWGGFAARHGINPDDLLLNSFPNFKEWKAPAAPDDTGGGGGTVEADTFPAPAGTVDGDVYDDPQTGSHYVAKNGVFTKTAKPPQPRVVK